LGYDVAAKVKNIEAAPFAGVSLADFDVLLVDTGRVNVGATTAASKIWPSDHAGVWAELHLPSFLAES
jgi:hypothetical protein